MGFTTFAHQKVLNAYAQAAALSSPATHYVGLGAATTWATAHAYSLGAYVIPTTFSSITTQTGKIFKCTTAGTSAGSEPTWPTTTGATVSDGGAVWTEVSLLFAAGTFTGFEMTGTAYARVAMTANNTNFAGATSAQPAVTQNAVAINFPTPGSDWGFAAGFIISDASSSGNIWFWGTMSAALDCAAGSSPSFAISALSLQMTP